ncbi:uncharacterized protein A1O9_08197 [Exophiala aquamarina CBS 119918]|uniref:GPI anchored protein n=1 Tax=Exophiala aquamarina CBS 119918 TaxID=1182545 RepID=A0A072P6T9_9EURO|nr:uncharacterized protein A1O9_08197 [Exophiala aquamarina CBS 119918]KEF55447.1 hypothetical protein A1O9_08197 [Exophiala aquamarina CBS 119918]
MTLMKKSAVAMALAGAVSAQSTSSVVSVFFPDIDNQALVGSVITSDASQTTMVVACPSSASDTDCGLFEPVTVTVGPQTFHVSIDEPSDDITVVLDCAMDGTTAATCAQTYIGPQAFLETDISVLTASDATTNTAITTSVTSTVLAQSEISFIGITLVDSIDASAAATTGASGTASTASSTGSGTSTSSGSSTASQTGGSSTSSGTAAATGTGTSNGASRTDGRPLVFSVLGAGLLGLTALLL